jgi:hypothetical protein
VASIHVAYDIDRHAQEAEDADDLPDRCADRAGPAVGDAHALKLTEAALRCYARTKEPVLLRAAADASARLRTELRGAQTSRRGSGYHRPMEYRTLGRTGVKVSPLCLGAMMFGAWGTADHDESIRIIHRALDAGINFIDTADVYSFGESEEIVGKALAQKKRDKVVLATKVHGVMGKDPNAQGNSRRWIMAGARTACAGWEPTTSTSTRSTDRHRIPTSTRRWAP